MESVVSVSSKVAACRDCKITRNVRAGGGISSVTVSFCPEHAPPS